MFKGFNWGRRGIAHHDLGLVGARVHAFIENISLGCAVLGPVILILNFYRDPKPSENATFHVILVGLVLLLGWAGWNRRRLSLETLAWINVGVFSFITILGISTIGIAGVNGITLFLAVIIAAGMFGKRVGLTVLGVLIAFYALVGVLVATGGWGLRIDPERFFIAPGSWAFSIGVIASVLLFVVLFLGDLNEDFWVGQAIFDHSSDGYLEIDGNDRARGFNASLPDLIDRPVEELRRRAALSEILGPSSLSEVREILEEAWRGQLEEREIALGDGPTPARWLAIRAVPRLSRKQGAVLVLRDITARKRHELDLARSRDAAERASHEKTRFLTSVSHELRTPLTGILGFGQLLRSDARYPLVKEQVKSVDQILKSGNHLLHLIDQILDLSRIEQRKLSIRIQDTAPGPILRDCLAVIRQQADAANLAVTISGLDEGALPDIRVDPVRLRQILLNLLSNAVKYNTTGTMIGLGCSMVRDGFLRFEVRDDGPGIPNDRFSELFEPFNRLDADALGIDGTGIGLALSKELVELMSGGIGVESEVGAGASFWFEVPISETSAGAPSSASDAGSGQAPVRSGQDPVRVILEPRELLYIEDNAANRLLMEQIVRRVPSARLSTAHSVEKGLQVARSVPPELVLMDIDLPGINGVEALGRLRAIDGLARVPVVAVSADAIPSDISRAMAAGFDNYVIKPIKIDETVELIEELLLQR